MDLKLSNEEIIERLRTWVPTQYHELNDWDLIISRAELVEDKYIAFYCSFQTVYLDKETYDPVTYDRQHIIDGNYYYDYNTSEDGAGTYTFINPLKKKSVYDLMDELGIEYDE